MGEADEDMVNAYLAAISDLSLREASDLTGVPKTTIMALRRGKRPNFHPETRRKMEQFVEQSRRKSSGIVPRETGDDLEDLVQELATASPSERRRLLYLLRALRAADTGEGEPRGS
jgi:hypothetical protein